MKPLVRNIIIGATIAGIGLVTYGAYRTVKKRKGEKQTGKFARSTKNINGITINTIEQAQTVADALGTSSPWYNPSGWFHDQQRAIQTIKAIPKQLIPSVGRDYYDITKNDMQSDLKKYLSSSQYLQIRGQFL
jgi:hypothetical protein